MAEKDTGVKTPQQVKDAESIFGASGLDFQSYDEFQEDKPTFAPLTEGVYKIKVETARMEEKTKYQSEELAWFIDLMFTVEATDSGSPIVDVDKKEHEAGSKKLFESLNLDSKGFKSDGTPGKTRACLCALLGVDPNDNFSLESVESLEGKDCKAFIEVAKKMNGDPKNKQSKYMKA